MCVEFQSQEIRATFWKFYIYFKLFINLFCILQMHSHFWSWFPRISIAVCHCDDTLPSSSIDFCFCCLQVYICIKVLFAALCFRIYLCSCIVLCTWAMPKYVSCTWVLPICYMILLGIITWKREVNGHGTVSLGWVIDLLDGSSCVK